MREQAFFRLGSVAGAVCSIASAMSIASDWTKQWDLITISDLIYAFSLVVIPYALWHRIEDSRRKWKARICNVLTIFTALLVAGTSVHVIRELLSGRIYIVMLGILLGASALCMAYMAWALWDGGSAALGFGAVLLAGLTLSHARPFILMEVVRALWFLRLSYWFLRPMQRMLS